MDLRHIVAATDESEAGRRAVRAGITLAHRAGGRVTVMRAVTAAAVPILAAVGQEGVPEEFDYSGGAMERLQRWLEPELSRLPPAVSVELGIAFGAPGIEICRFAEDRAADLLVLGRKQRSQLGRLLLGDTADAVARRSRIPCLFVSRNTSSFSRILVALDGTPRGLAVLNSATAFAERLGRHLRAVTVEPKWAAGKRHRLAGWPGALPAGELLERRRGDIVEQVLLATEESNAEVLVFGYHRGGPPGIIEAGSTARRLAHTAPCAVLTIPL
ncbi:MAG: universal stress protein [Gemmatimonadales bacterium]